MRFKIYLVGFVMTLAMSSCNDILDLEPISDETSASAYDKLSQIEAALTGAYATFQSDHYVWNNVIFQDVRSDNHYAGGDNTSIYEVDYLTVSPTNSKIYQSWGNLYNGILKANLVMEKAVEVTDPQLTDDRRNQIIGEALFLRAYHYYNLVTLYGGVPLILKATNSTESSAVNIPRSTAAEVFAQIIIDCDDAADLLPDTYGTDASVNKARATAGAAYALAAKACAQKPTPDYAQVLEYIKKVDASKANYKLIDYTELFDGAHYNNAESIIEVQYLSGSDGNWGPQCLLPPSISGDTWRKFITPSHDLIDAYDAEGDEIRKNASVLFESVSWVDEYWGNAVGSSIPFAYKWKNASGWSSSDRPYLLRYGDIVLLKAEALNETGELDLAATEVNRIRNRVDLSSLTAEQKSSKEVLRTVILNERRLELAQESQRWDDLVRYGVAVETMNNLQEIDLRTGLATDYQMTEAKMLLPIPQQELDRNPNLEQNPL